LAIMFVLNALVALPRVATYGLDIAYVTRYYAETAFVLPFVLAFAFSAPRTSRQRAEMQLRRPRGAVAGWTCAAIAAYLVVVGLGDHETVQQSLGRQVRPWVDRLQASLDRVGRVDPHPVLLDARVPDVVVPGFVRPPANMLSGVVPTFDDSVRFDDVARRTYSVRADGTLVPVVFTPMFGGSLARLHAQRRAALVGGAWRRQGADTCVVAGASGAQLRLQPPSVLRGHPWWLQAVYHTQAAFGLPLRSNIGLGYSRQANGALLPSTSRAERLMAFPSLPGPPAFAGIMITVPAQATACFSQLAIGWFRSAPRPSGAA
jgi:hypothetical protein